MFDSSNPNDLNFRWEREIARLAEVLSMKIDPDDERLVPVKRLFPAFEKMTQADPKELMKHADVKLDIENPAIVEAYNKGSIMTASMILLSLIQSHLR